MIISSLMLAKKKFPVNSCFENHIRNFTGNSMDYEEYLLFKKKMQGILNTISVQLKPFNLDVFPYKIKQLDQLQNLSE